MINLETPKKLIQYRIVSPFKGPEFAVYIAKDGDKWAAGLGNNIQEGLVGFGDTIPLALCDLVILMTEELSK